MRVLGIDPGYDRTGVAVLSGNGNAPVHVFSTCITTDKRASLPERLRAIGEGLRAIIREHQPTVCAIETLYFTKNQKTAMSVAAARGAVMLIAAESSLSVAEYTPPQVKVAVTGYGRSGKSEMTRMLSRLIPASKNAKLDDEVDAIAVALTHLAHLRATYPHKRP